VAKYLDWRSAVPEDGAAAYRLGVTLSANPFTLGCKEHVLWNIAFQCAGSEAGGTDWRVARNLPWPPTHLVHGEPS
jgi:hypothetical protein